LAANNRLLVAGSINTDLVVRTRRAPEAGETVTGTSFATFGGGKGANQAVAAARAGGQVAMLSGVGVDDFGRQRLHDLEAEAVTIGTPDSYLAHSSCRISRSKRSTARHVNAT
jgi:sugar/nucleoside kinase (ribokinase family)